MTPERARRRLTADLISTPRPRASHGSPPRVGEEDPVAVLARLARERRRAGQRGEAVTIRREAVALAPHRPGLHAELGRALLENGDARDACRSILRALAIDGGDPSVHALHGLALRRMGRGREAVEAFRRAIGLAPDHAAALAGLGASYRDIGRLREAATALEKAVELEPGVARHYVALGFLYLDLRDVQTAEGMADQAVRLDPDLAAAHALMGAIHAARGRTREAVAAFSRAVEIRPELESAWRGLARTGRAEDAERVEQLLASERLKPESRRRLHLALGHAHERERRFGAAFAQFQKANALRISSFDREAHVAAHRRVEAVCDAAYFRREDRATWGDRATRPIVLLGMPGSGVEVVEAILTEHPHVIRVDGSASGLGRAAGGGAGMPLHERLGQVTRCSTRAAASNYLLAVGADGSDEVRSVDRASHGGLGLGLFALAFPKAVIVRCRRDPIETCLAAYFDEDSHRAPFTHDLEDLVVAYECQDRLLDHWRAVLPLPIHEVCFEDLVAEPDRTVSALLSTCALEAPAGRLAKTVSRVSRVERRHAYGPLLGPLERLR